MELSNNQLMSKLKQFNPPDLYIWNYFNDLKNKIDLVYSERLLNEENMELIATLNNDLNQIIDKIKTIEQQCLSALKQDTLSQILKNKTKIKQEINELESSEQTEKVLNHIEDLVYAETTRIGAILFLNKTVVFLDIKSCTNDLFNGMNEKTTVGILLIVHNAFFGSRGTRIISE